MPKEKNPKESSVGVAKGGVAKEIKDKSAVGGVAKANSVGLKTKEAFVSSRYAFPLAEYSQFGLTKREYIAAVVAAGLADPDEDISLPPTELANQAVAITDALMSKLGI